MGERYDNLDGLRAISCLCIIAMHIEANARFSLNSTFAGVISSWTHLVPLFLMISGFGMFCGYYNRFRRGDIALNDFYKKRYKKILPFFAAMLVLDMTVSHSFSHLIEGITLSTLVFGLLPNNQPEVIGVSWTIGIIFLFYMLFPFIVFLFWTKKRAVFVFLMSIAISLFCSSYYFSDRFVVNGFAARNNFLYSAPWILGGGIVYLFLDEFKELSVRHRRSLLCLCVLLTCIWYVVPGSGSGTMMLKNLFLFIPWLSYAISGKSIILSNRMMKYLSGISLEMYLAQMVVFRILEKLKILYIAGDGWLGFVFTWGLLVAVLIVFIESWKICWNRVMILITKCQNWFSSTVVGYLTTHVMAYVVPSGREENNMF